MIIQKIKKIAKQTRIFLFYLFLHPRKFYDALSDKIKKWILRGLVVLLVFLIILFAVPTSIWYGSKKTQAAWWNDMWMYRQAVTITNSSSFDAINIPYRSIIDTQSLISAGKMQADADDIRVTDIGGNLVRFQVEESTLNTTTTGIWIEAVIGKNTSATYYVYYGNSLAVAADFETDVNSISGNGATVEMKDGFGYSTSTSYGRLSDIRKNGANLGVNGSYRYTTGYPGSWWDDRAFAQTLLASGPLFVEVKFEDTNYGNYSSFGTIVKMFDNGFVESMVYLNYNTSGSDQLYYYLNFDTGTRNSVWVNAAGTLVDQDADSGSLNVSSLKDNWFGQRWTASGFYGGTIINRNSSDWTSGNTSTRNSYYQTNYSSTVAYVNGTRREIRFGTFSGDGGLAEMNEKGSLYGANSNTLNAEEKGTGPIGYWSFDEGAGPTAHDATGNRNDGTIANALWKSESECVSGSCMYFDETGDNVNLGGNDDLTNNISDITIGAWVRLNAQLGSFSDNYEIISNESYQNNGYLLRVGNTLSPATAGSIHFRFSRAGASSSITTAANVFPNDHQWHHLVGVKEGSAGRIYLDGKLVYSGSGLINPVNATGSTYIGGNGQLWNGFLDEVKVYSFARSAAQIKMDYNVGLAGTGGAEGASVSMGGKSQKWMTDGLVGHWKMDETSWAGITGEVKDASGSGNNGTATNGAVISTGKFGNGGSFDGVNDYVNIGTPASLNITGNVSVGAWVKTGISSATYANSTLAGNYSQYFLSLGDYTASTPRVTGFVNISGVGWKYIKGNTAVNDGQWHYVSITYDGNYVRVYKDGILDANPYPASGGLAVPSNFLLGAYGTSNVTNANLDEVRVYNRALSPQEIKDLYNFAPGPVGEWNFEEKTGATVNDTSGNGNTGTLAGNPVWKSAGECKQGACLTLDRVDDRMTVNHSTTLEPASITVEAWIKLNDIGDRHILITKWYGYSFEISGSRYPYFRLNGITPGDLYSSQPITWGRWHHIAATLDNTTKQRKIYLDGVNTGSDTVTGSISYSQGGLAIPYSSAIHGSGAIDQVKIYNYARTPAQIMADYGTGQAQKQPIGYWKFDEGYSTTANNSGVGGSTINGTLTSGPTWSNNGKFSKALSFDGVDDYVSIGTGANYFPMNTFSLCAWIKTPGLASGMTNNGIISITYGLSFYLTSGGQMATIMDNGSSLVSSSAGDNLYDNNWHRVCMTYDGTNQHLFADGVEKSSLVRTWLGTTRWPTHVANIGHENNNPPVAKFNGLIDEVKIYNYNLTADEIKSDYNQGKSIQLGSSGTTAMGAASNAADRAYCPPGDATASCGPIAEWKFDEGANTTAQDTSGNGRFGTLTNMDAATDWIAGKIGKALDLDGSNDFVSLTRFSHSSTGVTMGAWIKTTSTDSAKAYAGNAAQNVIGDTTGGVGLGFGITGGKIQYMHYNGSWVGLAGVADVNDGKWHYISVTHSSSGAVALYLDGKLDNSGTITFAGARGIDCIGRGYSADYFTGQLDDIKVYNYVRTPAQVAWDYNRGKPVGWWKMDEGEGTTVYDWSGNANNGTLTNMDAATDWVDGKINKALDFDGSNDHVLTSPTIFSGDMTISTWFRPETFPSDWAGVGCFQYHGGSSGTGWQITPMATGIKLIVGRTGVNYITNTVATTVPTNEWSHILATYSGGIFKVYLNGKKVGADWSQSVVYDAAGDKVHMGRWAWDYNGYYFDGQIDDVRVYNYALTPEQIEGIYNGGAVKFGN